MFALRFFSRLLAVISPTRAARPQDETGHAGHLPLVKVNPRQASIALIQWRYPRSFSTAFNLRRDPATVSAQGRGGRRSGVMTRLGLVAGLAVAAFAVGSADAQQRPQRQRGGPQTLFEVEQVAITAGRL